jgi:hypothetical protein
MKEPIHVRVEPSVRTELEELARRNGRTLSEELSLAVSTHLAAAQTTALAVVPSTDPVGFLRQVADIELVRDVSPELAPALALMLEPWEADREGIDPGLHLVEKWVDARVEQAIVKDRKIEQLRVLGRCGLLPTQKSYGAHRGALVRLLEADLVSRRALQEWAPRIAAGATQEELRLDNERRLAASGLALAVRVFRESCTGSSGGYTNPPYAVEAAHWVETHWHELPADLLQWLVPRHDTVTTWGVAWGIARLIEEAHLAGPPP